MKQQNVWKLTLLTGVVTSSILAGCGTSDSTSTTPSTTTTTTFDVSSLKGAGSSFDGPFFQKTFYNFGGAHNLQINYTANGSGAGISSFTQQIVDFGATDVPMNDKDLAKVTAGDVVQIPVALGATAIAYNVPEVKDPIKLTSDDLARIFLGVITKWNDPALVKNNPGVALPDKAIQVVHRSDGSGTTYIFSDYLDSVSPAWDNKVGKGKDLKWPVGVGAKGTDGVAGQIKNTPYSIGYVELAYALQTNMQYASLQNKDGKFVAPSLDSATAAASAKPNVTAKDFSIVNEPGKDSYPITGYSWALLYKNQKDDKVGKALVNLFDWVVTSGQDDAKALNYAPLPKNVQDAAVASLKTIQANGAALLK